MRNLSKGEQVKTQQRSLIERKIISFEHSRMSLGPETAHKKQSDDAITLGDYF